MKNLLKITVLSKSFTTIDTNFWKPTANFFTFPGAGFSEKLENRNQKESGRLLRTISGPKGKWSSLNLSSTSNAPSLTCWKGNPTKLRELKASARIFCFKTFSSPLNTELEHKKEVPLKYCLLQYKITISN